MMRVCECVCICIYVIPHDEIHAPPHLLSTPHLCTLPSLRDSEPPLPSQPRGFSDPERWGSHSHHQTSLSGRVSPSQVTFARPLSSTGLHASTPQPQHPESRRLVTLLTARDCDGTLRPHVAALLCSTRLRHYDKRAVRSGGGRPAGQRCETRERARQGTPLLQQNRLDLRWRSGAWDRCSRGLGMFTVRT